MRGRKKKEVVEEPVAEVVEKPIAKEEPVSEDVAEPIVLADEPVEQRVVDDEPDAAPEDTSDTDAMNEYAAKVWNGQSPDLPKGERIYRVMNALAEQGYLNTDKLVLPNG